MKRVSFLAACLTIFGGVASAYEYPLQFTANSGARGLVVAGYAFNGDTVVGNCSYYTVSSGSGKGGGYKPVYTYYNQTCTWDLYGNLLGIAPGAPTAPPPLYTNGTQTVYATNGSNSYTGSDSALPPTYGFVSTTGSHYTWTTPNPYTDLQQILYTFTITLKSDGDSPLSISAVSSSALIARTRVQSTTCIGQIAVGSTCSIVVIYNPLLLSSSTGLAYDTLDVGVASDAGVSLPFTQSFTITVRKGSGED